MKHHNITAVAIVAALLSGNVSAKEIDAPFGLAWGKSQSELEAKGAEIYGCAEKDNNFIVCKTKTPPKPVSFSDFYFLYFHSTKGLQKVIMVGEIITEDIYGSEGKKLYAQIKAGLTKKYGERSDGGEHIGLKLYDEYDEFYQCLAYTGCGLWVSLWEDDSGGTVVVQLKGYSRGKGWVQIVYEPIGYWQITATGEAEKTANDENAL